MRHEDQPEPEAAMLRDRLSRLSEASLRINETLDLESVLQSVLDSARSLTNARYGVITTLSESGEVVEFLTSGLTPAESEGLWSIPQALRVFEYLKRLPQTLRVRDLSSHMRSLGVADFRLPVPVRSFLCTLMHNRGLQLGIFYLAEKEEGTEFTAEDEETLVMFASQSALVIANDLRYRDEQRAKTDLETLVNTAPVGVIVFDAKTGAVTSINREARRIVSKLHEPDSPAEELLEVLTVRRADGREVPLDRLSLGQALSGGETVRAEEIVMQVPGGPSVTTLINATPIRSEEGDVETYVVTLQDMTPREELEQQRAEFLGVVSHELRAPLTSIKGSVDILMESLSDLDLAEMVQLHRLIRDQTENMRELIGNLLDMARIETGTLSVAPEPADVASLVDRARNIFLSGGGRDNLLIDVPLDLPWVMADRRRVVQVLTNLLSNAARNSHESSPIRLTASRERLHVAVSVIDEGRGVSGEDLPKLFRKFSRLEGAEPGGGIAGSGMGLSICKGIVEAHGGRIWAESDGPGLGARFTFTIPTAEESPATLGNHAAHSPQRRGGTERILVVDDDPQMLQKVRGELAKAGYAPVVTADPEEALRILEADRPSLVLLDLMMPGTDGLQLLPSILDIADVPVIFLSVYGRDEVVARAFEAGAADYVTKPFSSTELVARVRAALRRGAVSRRAEPQDPYVADDLMVNYAERSVTVADRPVRLTATEYRLLVELSVNAGTVLTHEELLERVWGLGNSGDVRLVRGVVKRLRGKLGDKADDPKYIFTELGVGYRIPKRYSE